MESVLGHVHAMLGEQGGHTPVLGHLPGRDWGKLGSWSTSVLLPGLLASWGAPGAGRGWSPAGKARLAVRHAKQRGGENSGFSCLARPVLHCCCPRRDPALLQAAFPSCPPKSGGFGCAAQAPMPPGCWRDRSSLGLAVLPEVAAPESSRAAGESLARTCAPPGNGVKQEGGGTSPAMPTVPRLGRCHALSQPI